MLPPVLIQGDRLNIRKKKIYGRIKGPIDVISGTIGLKASVLTGKLTVIIRHVVSKLSQAH